MKIYLYLCFKGIVDIIYGILSELKVKKDFEFKCLGGRNVVLVGIVVSRIEFYFLCSLNGII